MVGEEVPSCPLHEIQLPFGGWYDWRTQVMVFLLSFATQDGAGDAHPFPTWWGNNNYDAHGNPQNFDPCLCVN